MTAKCQINNRAEKQLKTYWLVLLPLVLPDVTSSFSSSETEIHPHLKGNINHSVCRWCYNSVPLEEFCAAVKEMGFKAIDLVGPKDWPTLTEIWSLFFHV